MLKDTEFNGERLKIARLYRGKTISELAGETGISKQAISQFENNKTAPGFETVLNLMNSLNFPREYFHQKDNIKTVEGNTFFRALSSTSKKEQLCQINKTKILVKIYCFFEQYIDFPKPNIPDISKANGDIEIMAKIVREVWGLGDKPINNIINVMEKNGIIISSFNTNDGKIDAFTQSHLIDGKVYPFVILGDDKEAAVRRQFSAAHELAHIILHDMDCNTEEITKEEYKYMEEQANDFAAAILLPRDAFLADVSQYPNKLDFYVELKKKWRVSISAMIIRAFRLNAITHNQYQYLMKQLSKRGWRTKEPLDDIIKISKPTVLKKAVDILLVNNILTESQIIEELSNYGLALPAEEIEILLGLEQGMLQKTHSPNVSLNLKNNISQLRAQ